MRSVFGANLRSFFSFKYQGYGTAFSLGIRKVMSSLNTSFRNLKNQGIGIFESARARSEALGTGTHSELGPGRQCGFRCAAANKYMGMTYRQLTVS